MSELSILAVRHTAPLRAGLCAGHADFAVEPVEPVVSELLRVLTGEPITRIVTSPSRRCAELAERLAEGLHLPLDVDSRLRELYFGEWEARSWVAIQSTDPERLTRWGHDWLESGPPGGESARSMARRVQSVADEQPAGCQLWITHAGPIRALSVLFADRSWDQAMAESVPYASPLRFSAKRSA